jgi:transcription elongation factor Elf1
MSGGKRGRGMSDLIKRSDAIKAIDELPNAYNGWSDAYDKAYIIGTLEELPSADRPRGEWIDLNDEWGFEGTFKCSACGELWSLIDGTPQDNGMNFCPNCGADMGKGE